MGLTAEELTECFLPCRLSHLTMTHSSTLNKHTLTGLKAFADFLAPCLWCGTSEKCIDNIAVCCTCWEEMWGKHNRRVNLGGEWNSHSRRCQRRILLTQLGHNDIGHVRVEMYLALSNNESGS